MSESVKIDLPKKWIQPPTSLTEAFHRAWSNAVGLPDYDKNEWREAATRLKIDGYK